MVGEVRGSQVMKVRTGHQGTPQLRRAQLSSWTRYPGMPGASAEAHYELLCEQHRSRARDRLPRALRRPVMGGGGCCRSG